MYNITEIKYQNQQDCLSMLYMYVTESLVKHCGRGAEGAVRAAVRDMGRDWGCAIRRKHLDAGVKTNLYSLYNTGLEYLKDPRMCEDLISESEEVRLWEVRTCPLADLWNKAGAGERGLWYCEEFQRGLLWGYTDGKGQMNQSTFLTCRRDNHCRFSAYLRAANLEGKRREESFSFPGEIPSVPKEMGNASFAEGIRIQFIRMYCYLLSSAKERHGNEGVRAVALGLRRLSDELVLTMRRHAEHTLERCDEAFLKLNFPIALETSEDDLWRRYDANDASKLIQINLLDRMKKRLGFPIAV
jgi:hypothetical protein